MQGGHSGCRCSVVGVLLHVDCCRWTVENVLFLCGVPARREVWSCIEPDRIPADRGAGTGGRGGRGRRGGPGRGQGTTPQRPGGVRNYRGENCGT